MADAAKVVGIVYPHGALMNVLNNLRETYRSGYGVLDGALLQLADGDLLKEWQKLVVSDHRANFRGWYKTLYRDGFAGKSILEIGSGRGGDGVYFSEHGAKWTFSDIIAGNLDVIRRVCDAKGIDAGFVYIDDDFSCFRSLPMYDAIWCNLSLSGAPFEIARTESLAILPHLKPEGRWMESAYAVSEFRNHTYDLAKIRRRLFPAPMDVVLDYRQPGSEFVWFDLAYSSQTTFDPQYETREVKIFPSRRPVLHGVTVLERSADCLAIGTPMQAWSYAASFDLTEAISGRFLIEVDCSVEHGRIGVLLTGDDMTTILGEEIFVTLHSQNPTISFLADGNACRHLVFRNAKEGRSNFKIKGVRLIEAR